MESIFSVINTNNNYIILFSLGISVFSIIILLINMKRTGRVLQKYNRLMSGMENQNLEEMLTNHLENVEKALVKTKIIEKQQYSVDIMAQNAIQNVGVVRFNAFEDTGSDLSFAVALLNHHGDGLVFSGLFGRSETRTYVKPVNNGASNYQLSYEEEIAIKKALHKS